MLSMYIASRRAQSQPIGSLAPQDFVLGTNSGRIDEDETFGWGKGGDVFCFKPLDGHHVLQVLIHPHKTQLSLSIPPPASPWMITVYSPKKWNQPLGNGYHRMALCIHTLGLLVLNGLRERVCLSTLDPSKSGLMNRHIVKHIGLILR